MIAGSIGGVAFCIEHSRRFHENVGLPGARSSVSAEEPEEGSQLLGDRRRRFGIAPGWLVGAIAPGPWPIEGVDSELMQLGHLAHPARTHPIGVVVCRLPDR